MRDNDLSSKIASKLATENAGFFEFFSESLCFLWQSNFYGFADTTTKYPPSRLASDET